MLTIQEALALKDSAGLEAAVDALVNHCPEDVPAGSLAVRLVAIGRQVGLNYGIGPSGELLNEKLGRLEPATAIGELADALEANKADREAVKAEPETTAVPYEFEAARTGPEVPDPNGPFETGDAHTDHTIETGHAAENF